MSLKTKIISLSAILLLCSNSYADVLDQSENIENNRTPTYVITKSSLFNQASYDFKSYGYKTIWNVKQNPTFILQEFPSKEDEMVYIINRLNQVGAGTHEDGNLVNGLICQKKKEIHFVYSSKADLVVDSDGQTCDMVTPLDTQMYLNVSLEGGAVTEGNIESINSSNSSSNGKYDSRNKNLSKDKDVRAGAAVIYK